MNQQPVEVSPTFKEHAIKAVLGITLFIISYIFILGIALVLTVLCILGGLFVIAVKPMFITIGIGLGLAGMGVFIVIFLLKFIFSSHKNDRSQMVEIFEHEHPKLFEMIHQIVQEVGTTFPKKVYVSPEVNASVFYDSSFWSMFLPVKKNLTIGLGLVNSVTREELKAILAHEFGHFSQKSMKVGSYVYYVNQVIFNMLFENETYDKLVQKWLNISRFFSLFILISLKINQGIQWILRKLYHVVNISYMSLSREMEFHADAIAASITGYQPLKNSLLRMNMVDHTFQSVIHFYERRIPQNIQSKNIYHDHKAAISFISAYQNIPIRNGLPDITLEEQNKYNKSKLIIKDQWSSHPSTEDRILHLEKTGRNSTIIEDAPADVLFNNLEHIQQTLSRKMFDEENYTLPYIYYNTEDFIETFMEEIREDSFPKIFNEYYDKYNIMQWNLDETSTKVETFTFQDLFSDTMKDKIFTYLALADDIQSLKDIVRYDYPISTFDYDGIRHKAREADQLIVRLEMELEDLKEQIHINDQSIYRYFSQLEKDGSGTPQLKDLYTDFFDFDKKYDVNMNLYNQFKQKLQFVQEQTPFEEITKNFKSAQPLESQVKDEIQLLLKDPILEKCLTPDIRENLETYVFNSHPYFNGKNYDENRLQLLFSALSQFGYLLVQKYFLIKMNLLKYQEQLELKKAMLLDDFKKNDNASFE